MHGEPPPSRSIASPRPASSGRSRSGSSRFRRHLIGAGHLLFAGRDGLPPPEDDVRMVTTVVAGALP